MQTTPVISSSLRHFGGCFLALLLLLSWSACTDPITVGSDLLEGDRIDVDFNGEVPIRTRTIAMDTFSVFDAGSNSLWPRSPFGIVSDDVFGRTSAGIHLYFRPNRSSFSNDIAFPEFIEFADDPDVSLDSVVIILGVDTSSFYGPINETVYNYELRELNSQPDFNENILLTERFQRGDLASDETSFTLTDVETLLADTLIRSDSTTAFQQRFRLNNGLLQRLAALDTFAFETDSTFADIFPGFFLEPTGESAGIFNFDMSGAVDFDGMVAFYTDTVGEPQFYSFPLIRWLPSVERDLAGTTAEMLLDADADDELTLIQSTAGLLTEINLTDLTEFEGQIINQAQLEIYPAALPGFDADRFPEPETLMLFAKDEDDRLVLIEDLASNVLPNASQANIRFFVGGVYDEDDQVYRLNLTVQLQRILNDPDFEPVVYLAILPRIVDPASFIRNEIDIEYGRLPLNGPTATDRPMRLRVAYTRL
ncbi:MAG: DUF4270 family protein [Bacteroidota bacterium]